MGGSFIKIEGLEKTLARFDVKKYEPQIQTCFNRFGLRVELEAKQLKEKLQPFITDQEKRQEYLKKRDEIDLKLSQMLHNFHFKNK